MGVFIDPAPRLGYGGAMRLPLATLVVVALLAACGGRTTTQVPAPWTPADPAPVSAEDARLLDLVNEARATATTCGSHGTFPPAGPLAIDPRLSSAALDHSAEMRRLGVMSHVGADGSTVGDRVTRQGYAWRSVGENVARGYDTPESVVSGWLGSAGHCANIMAADFVHLGVGRDDLYWTQVFGRPR
jgi:uncharacterized protein YkwD